jgi:hypothetical protein
MDGLLVEIIKELVPELQFDEEGMPVVDPMGGGGMPGMMPGMHFPMGRPTTCLDVSLSPL